MVLVQSRSPHRLSEFLEEPPHALRAQALAPRELQPNLPSADGWGVAWYPEAEPEPAAYHTVIPMWRDPNLHTLTPHVGAPQFIAATRVATGTSELALPNVQPFVSGRVSFAHNGELVDFDRAFLPLVRARLSDASQSVPRGATDSAHLFALFLDALGRGLSEAADQLVAVVRELCDRVERGAMLNVLASDGADAIAIRYATPGMRHPSLYWRNLASGIVVASEALDDDASWRTVAKNTRLSFRGGELVDTRVIE